MKILFLQLLGILGDHVKRTHWLFVLVFGLIISTPSLAEWAALATTDDGAWGVSVRRPSKVQAESEAIKNCNKYKTKEAKCKIAGALDQIGYAAVVQSTTRIQISIQDTLEDAKRYALDNCAKHTSPDDVCRIEWTDFNGVIRNKSEPSNNADCRPKTREIRCRSNCTNGNCVVEYENGCKIRVQVTPRFDSFSNQWTYPSPSC